MSVIAVIPARGGSKGIPRKNLAIIAGRPLIAYAIDAAIKANYIDRVVVSTEDREIANIAEDLGAEVPFIRPVELADDVAPMIGTLSHAQACLESMGEEIEALVLLQPTSPLRTSRHIDEAVALFRSTSATSVVSVTEVPHHFTPTSVMRISSQGNLCPFLDGVAPITRRQDKPRLYARNGPAVLVCDSETLRSGELYGENCLPYVMSIEDSLDIDTPHDLCVAERILTDLRRQRELIGDNIIVTET